MLRGEKVALRSRYEADVPILYAELYEDMLNHARADGRVWRPIAPTAPGAPYSISEPAGDDAAPFSVVLAGDSPGGGQAGNGQAGEGQAGGELVGEAVLWGIDTHNRSGHLGISLRPRFRGQGLGTDAVRVLCAYGFRFRGLHRLQIETLADNTAMIRAALRAGFEREGVLRRAAWVAGEFVDQVIFGRLADPGN